MSYPRKVEGDLLRWNFIFLLVAVPAAAVILGNDPVFWVLVAAALVNFALWAAWSRR
jgi:hypothetical protein